MEAKDQCEDAQQVQVSEICKQCEALRAEIHQLKNRKIELEELIAKTRDEVLATPTQEH